ncbi:hypothetical protein SO694_0002136 [Aureococcus anophagefferens]|uniref:Uncharacterized protein n=1 Tax=Aureococcus anophagefferens TaxID=44056 RepID=A0ABR1FU84_AURAN
MLPQSPANITPAEQSEPGFTIRAAFLLWWDIQESMQRFIKSTFAVLLGADGSSCLAKRIRAAWAKSLRDQTGLRNSCTAAITSTRSCAKLLHTEMKL